MFRRTMYAAVLSAAVALLAPAAAQAELNWSSIAGAQTISPSFQNATNVQVDTDAAGNSVAAWLRSDGSNTRVQAAFRPAGGTFGAPAYISPAGTTTSSPKVAVSRGGDAMVIWNRVASGNRTEVVGRYRPAGGSFPAVTSAPEVLSATLYSTGGVDIAMAPDGSAVLVTTGVRIDTGLPQATARRRSAGASGTIIDSDELYTPTNTTGRVASPRVEIDQQGTILAAFADAPTTTNQDLQLREIRAAKAPADNVFEDSKVIATRNTDFSIEMEDIAISNGASIVGYNRNIGAGRSTVLTAYRAAGAANFDSPQALDGSPTDPQQAAYDLDLDMFPDGEAVALYTKLIAGNPIVQIGYRKKSGIQATLWSGITRVDNLGPADTPRVDVDDSDRGVIQWTEHGNAVGEGPGPDKVWVRSITDNGQEGALHQIASGDIPETQLSVSPGGQAVSVRTRTDTNASLVAQASFGAPPGAPAPPVVSPPPPIPPEPPSAIQLARPLTAGKATVLTVAASSAVTRIEWNIDGSPKVIAPGTLRSIRFRPDRNFTATVRVFSPGGTRTTSRTFRGPAVPDDPDAKKVYRRVQESGAGVYAAGDASVLLGGTSFCGTTVIYASRQTTNGCFRPVETLGDIPSAEKGVLARLSDAFALNASDTGLMRRAVELTEGYVGSGAAFLDNAWPLYPTSSARIMVYPQASTLLSSNASIRVGGQSIKPAGSGFNLKLDPSSSGIPLGNVPRPSGFSGVGGFPFTGDFSVTLPEGPDANFNAATTTRALVQTSLRLPSYINRNGAPITIPVVFRPTPFSLTTDGLSVSAAQMSLGILRIKNFSSTFDQASDEWRGRGDACIFDTTCLELAPPGGELTIKNGKIARARVSRNFGSPGRPLTPGAFLESATLGVGLDPTRLFGSARVGVAGEFMKVDGRAVLAFPSSSTPYRLRADEAGNAFPAPLYNRNFTLPTIAASANLILKLPVLGETTLGNGYFAYEFPGYATFGGGSNLQILDTVSISGSLSGEFDAKTPAYNLHGDVRACVNLVKNICAGAVAHTSRGLNLAGGIGSCVTLGPISIGGGYKWNSPVPLVWPFDGCKWSPFRINLASSAVRAAQAGGYRLRVTKGGPSPALKLSGRGGAPLVRVLGPGGQRLDSTDKGLDLSPGGKIRILRFAGRDAQTVVGLQDARPGVYTVSTQPGSVPVSAISRTTDLPDAKVKATVSGKGNRRTLKFDVLRRSGQTVRFYEVTSSGASKQIGRTVSGGRGKFRFSPAPGTGTRRIIAAFGLSQVPAETRTIARFRPPPPRLGAVRKVTVSRKGTRVSMSWRRVKDAARYEIALSTSSGRQKFVTTRRTSVRFKGVAKTTSGRATVRAVDDLRQGKTAGGSFKRIARPTNRFQTLKRCKVSKKKITGCGKAKAKKKARSKAKARKKSKAKSKKR